MAAVLIATLSAPDLSAEFTLSTDLIPPLTVIGTKIFFVVSFMISSNELRSYKLATISS